MLEISSNKFRFLVSNINLDINHLSITDKKIINQWRKVLRFKKGQVVYLFDGQGHGRFFTLIEYDSQGANLQAYDDLVIDQYPNPGVNLYLSLLKKENFELAIQKSVEIGIMGIYPIITSRVIKTGWRSDRISKITTEAIEQSGRSWSPIINKPVDFKQALVNIDPQKTILFDSRGDVLKNNLNSTRINIFIGPEGGFSQVEVDMAKQLGIKIMSLSSDYTLKSETATIIASYITINNISI